MTKTFEVNKKLYQAVPIDFGFMVDLEDMGIQLEQFGEKPMKLIRAYFCACSGMNEKQANAEIQAHIVGGGDVAVIGDALGDAISESDFFQAMMGATATPKKTTKKATTKATE